MKGIIINHAQSNFDKVYPKTVTDALGQLLEMDFVSHTKEELLENPALSRDADFAFSTWGMSHFDPGEIRLLFPKLKAVYYAAGSVQHFAREFIEAGIDVFSAWAANGVPVAEYTVSQIVLANKGFYQSSRMCNSPEGRAAAVAYTASFPGTYDGVTVGLIGAGMIGSMVAERLRDCYSMKVLCFDPFLSDDRAARLGVEKVSLERLFAESQTISNHLANNPQTVGMLHYGLFSRMKPNATFLNTGRGAQVVEDDLIRALREMPGRTAVLDVTWPEPPEAGSPLYTLPNVVLTPHIAGSLGVEVHRMSAYMLEELRNTLNGQPTRYKVTLKMLETMA